jgi:hypothetical protein
MTGERCRGAQEGKGGDGEKKEGNRRVFMQTHVHFTETELALLSNMLSKNGDPRHREK